VVPFDYRRQPILEVVQKAIPGLRYGIGGFVIGVVTVSVGLQKVKAEPGNFQLLGFLRKGFKRTPLEEYTGHEIIALGLLAFLAAAALVAVYYW